MAHSFVWDDWVLFGNRFIVQSLSPLPFWTNPVANTGEEHYWPVTYTVFWLQYRMFGTDPFGYHLLNISLHALNGVLIGFLLSKLNVPGAWCAALLFAVHPVHVESVAWVIELKDVLSAFFYLMSALAFFDTSQRRQRLRYGISLVLFALGMLSKSVVVTLPVALLLGIWWRKRRLDRSDLFAIAPFLVVAAVLVALDLFVLAKAETVHVSFPLADRLLISSRAFWFYVRQLVWQARVLAIHPSWPVWSPASYAAMAATITLLLFTLRMRARLRSVFTATVFYIVTLSPTLGMISFSYMQHSFVADRFQYLASIGPIALVSAAAGTLWSRRKSVRPVLAAAAMVVVAVLAFLTALGANRYRDNERLFRYTLQHNPNARMGYIVLGVQLASENRYQEAAEQFERALALAGNDAETHYNAGYAYWRLTRLDEAMRHLKAATRLRPDYANALALTGHVLAAQGNPSAAREHWAAALSVDPKNWIAKNAVDQPTSSTVDLRSPVARQNP